VVEKVPDEFKAELGHFEIVASKDNDHQLFHANELVWISFDGEDFLLFLFVGVSSRIDTHHTSIDQLLLFIDSQKTILEELELAAPNVLELFLSTKIILEELTDVFVAKLRQD
jgi:hypothetical protein